MKRNARRKGEGEREARDQREREREKIEREREGKRFINRDLPRDRGSCGRVGCRAA